MQKLYSDRVKSSRQIQNRDQKIRFAYCIRGMEERFAKTAGSPGCPQFGKYPQHQEPIFRRNS